jgi:hypothetical protein
VTAVLQTAFDYSEIDAVSKDKLIRAASEINNHKAESLRSMIAMGESIRQAQDLLANHGNGAFGKWIELECGISPRSAYNYLNAWEKFKDCESLSQFTAEGMYLLSSPSAPSDVTERAKKLASAGVRVTAKVAKNLIAAPDQPPSTAAADAERSLPKMAAGPTSPVSLTIEPDDELEQPPIAGSIPRADADSLEAVQADLREFERRLRELGRFGRTILRCQGDEITRPYCGEYSVLTLIHPLHHAARTVLNDLPVGGTSRKPKLFHEERLKAEAN